MTEKDARGSSSVVAAVVQQLKLLWAGGQKPDPDMLLKNAGPLSPLQTAEVLALDQWHRWRTGECISAADYLARHPAVSGDPEAALLLVYGEYLIREELGENPSKEDYAARFPQCSEGLRRQVDFHLAVERAMQTESLEVKPDDGQEMQPGAAPTRLAGAFGDFELLKELGGGAMGVVYRAKQLSVNRVVALKMIRSGTFANPSEVRRFRQEVEAVVALDHPRILPIYEVGAIGGQHYYTMRLAEGGSLASRMGEFKAPAVGTLAEARARQRSAAVLMGALARGVHHAHQRGILHRDLKPGNILLDENGEGYVADFGLARRIGVASSLTETGQVVGSPSYMAPEQARGEKDVTTQADVWGLGAILYELLSGRPPFVGATVLETLHLVQDCKLTRPTSLCGALDRDLETICLKCLERQPARRYESAAALAEELERWLRGEPILARPVGPAGRLRRWAGRNPTLAILSSVTLVLALVMLLGSATAAILLDHRAEQARRAEREANVKLFQSSLDQARANRLAGQGGQRIDSLKAIRQAVATGKALGYGPDRMLEVRNASIAALALSDLETVQEWEGYPPGSNGVAFDSRFERYARSHRDGTISLRRVADDVELARFRATAPDDLDERVILSFAAGDRLLTGWFLTRPEGPLMVWELLPAGPLLRLRVPGAQGICDVSADGRELIVGLPDSEVGVFDVASGRRIRNLPRSELAYHFAIRPGGRQVAVALNQPPAVQVRDFATGDLIREIPVPCGVHRVAWHPNEPLVAIAREDHSVTLWDADTGLSRKELHGHRWIVGPVAFDNKGDLLASYGHDATTRFWDIHTGRQLVMHSASQLVGFNAEAQLAAFVQRTRLRVAAVTRGTVCRTIATAPTWRGFIDFSADSRLLVSPGIDEICVCNVQDGRTITRFGVGEQVTSALFEPGGHGLLLMLGKGITRWPIKASGEICGLPTVVHPIPTRAPEPNQMEWWPQAGRGIVYSEKSSALRLLPLDPPGPVIDLCDSFQNPRILSSSADGRWIAGGVWGSIDGARVYDTLSRKLVLERRIGHAVVAFSPDNRWLAVSSGTSDPGGARCSILRVGSWEPVATIAVSRTSSPGHARFSADGKMLALQTTLNEVGLFETETFQELATLRAGEPSILGTVDVLLCFVVRSCTRFFAS